MVKLDVLDDVSNILEPRTDGTIAFAPKNVGISLVKGAASHRHYSGKIPLIAASLLTKGANKLLQPWRQRRAEDKFNKEFDERFKGTTPMKIPRHKPEESPPPVEKSSSPKMLTALQWAAPVAKLAKTGYDWYTEHNKAGQIDKIVSTGVNLMKSFNNAPERVIERKESSPHPINISVNANPHISNNSSSHSSSYGARNEAFPQYDETFQYSHRGYTYPPPETEYKLPTMHNPQASRVVRRSRNSHHHKHRKTRR